MTLKPCPFCGASVAFHQEDERYFIQCTKCHASSTAKYKKRELLAEQWNNRIEIPHEEVCRICYGTGDHQSKGDGIHDYCENCGGTGKVIV